MTTTTKAESKETFKRLLIEHKGDAKHQDVSKALDNLIELVANKEQQQESDVYSSPAHNVDINKGKWRSITTPPFRGKLDDETDGKTRFTLGRMSFGMFKPTTIVCAVDDIVNIVEDVKEEGDDTTTNNKDDAIWRQTYTIDVLMKIETPNGIKLPARLTNYGQCFPTSTDRLSVKFTQGTLKPQFDMGDSSNATLAEAWENTFGNAITKEAEAQGYIGKAGTWIMHKMMWHLMGLEPPTDSADYTQTFKITKPYLGYLDILYIDDDFRVTKGNKNTIVVVERLKEEE